MKKVENLNLSDNVYYVELDNLTSIYTVKYHFINRFSKQNRDGNNFHRVCYIINDIEFIRGNSKSICGYYFVNRSEAELECKEKNKILLDSLQKQLELIKKGL